MRVQDAVEIWLRSKTRLSFKAWLRMQGLTVTDDIVILTLPIDKVDIVKERKGILEKIKR